MKNLPVGISTFEKIRTANYLYVDKTPYALKLIERGSQYVFLSRPRRFGKSLFVSMLKSIFQAKKELFKGLYIYDKYDFPLHPVIYINFADGDFRHPKGLKTRVREILELKAQEADLNIPKTNDERQFFGSLIRELSKQTGKQVVVLIDEYDKPILDAINDLEVATQNKEYLKVLYSVLKANDEYIRFCFLTGVSKFSKVSVFSGLNNLEDITLDPLYDTVCGYTHAELEDSFAGYLQEVDKDKLAHWYNGYNFFKTPVYNPYDILLFFQKGNLYRSYWFETGTPTFLINLIKQQQYFAPRLDNLRVDEQLFNAFDIENLNIETLLFQTGYLTIKQVQENFEGISYILDFPNFEVRHTFNQVLFSSISQLDSGDISTKTRKAFLNLDMDLLRDNLYQLFAAIPYQNGKIHIYEGYYVNVIFTHLKTIGLDVRCEERTNKGRIDLVVQTPETIFLLEFKLGKENALQQIKSKGYHEKYADKHTVLLGINFDETERNITIFEWEEVN